MSLEHASRGAAPEHPAARPDSRADGAAPPPGAAALAFLPGAGGGAGHAAAGAGGAPLDPGTRAFFEGRFGHPLGGVRVHTGAGADRAARDHGAVAYAVGSDVAFRAGAYAPRSAEGRALLAHELAHVVQQRDGAPASASGDTDAEAGERDARASAARALVPGAGPAAPRLRLPRRVQRQPAGTAAPPRPATAQELAREAAEFLRGMRRFVAAARQGAEEDFATAAPFPVHTGYAQEVAAQRRISQTRLRELLGNARTVYQRGADALPGGDPLRAELRLAYIEVLSELRLSMLASLRLAEQLLAPARDPERRAFAENLGAWLDASPMTVASLAGTTAFGSADEAAARRWEAEMDAYLANVRDILPTLSVTAAERGQAAARIEAGLRRTSVTVQGGALRPVSDPARLERYREAGDLMRSHAGPAQPMDLITSGFPAYTPADPIRDLSADIPGRRVDTAHVPEAERLAVIWAVWVVTHSTFAAGSAPRLTDSWWPGVVQVRRGHALVPVRYELVFDHAGNVRAERLGEVPASDAPAAFAALPVADKKASLVRDFALAAVEDGTATWSGADLDRLRASLDRLPAPSRAALAGYTLIRDHAGPVLPTGGAPGAIAHVGPSPSTDAGLPAAVPGPPHIHVYDTAATGAALAASGAPGAAGSGMDLTIAHEVGHAVSGRAMHAANQRQAAALAALNGLLPHHPMPPAAITRWNTWRARQLAANTATVAFASSHGANGAALRAAAQAAIQARNAARAALAPSVPAPLRRAAAELDAANDAILAAGEHAPTFGTVARRLGFHPFTDYARDSVGDEEWFAETHALWVTDPERLRAMNRGVFLWFQAGMPMDPAWTPPTP